jgi:hypothetical protein
VKSCGELAALADTACVEHVPVPFAQSWVRTDAGLVQLPGVYSHVPVPLVPVVVVPVVTTSVVVDEVFT